MPTSPASLRSPQELSQSLLHQLSAYAIAATSAGVGVLALAGSAQAKIVFTAVTMRITNATILDFNRDHKPNFLFSTSFWNETSSDGGWLGVAPVGAQNRIWGTGKYASALSSGVLVGPNKKKFQQGHGRMLGWAKGWWGSSSTGPWEKVTRGYLGLKFVIQGKTHYGWACISMKPGWYVVGYAYETIPNKPIITGKTRGPDATALEPASLGHLARGSAAH